MDGAQGRIPAYRCDLDLGSAGRCTEAPPTHELCRRLPADAFNEAERSALQTLLASTRLFGVVNWPEALAGDDAAGVAIGGRLAEGKWRARKDSNL